MNVVGGAFSPRAHPSVDDHLLSDNAWSQFQLAQPGSLVMPIDSTYTQQYPKSTLDSTAALFLDDVDRNTDAGLTHYQRPRSFSAYQRLRQSAQFNTRPNHSKSHGWRHSVSHSASYAPTQFPISPPLEAQPETSMAPPLNTQWFPTSDAPSSVDGTENYVMVPHDSAAFGQFRFVKAELTPGSRSPSIYSNGIAVSIDSFNGVANHELHNNIDNNNNTVKEEQFKILEWEEPVSPEKSLESSPQFPKVNGYMVSSDISDVPQMSLESERRVSAGSRRTPLTFQPASVARKRKQRNSSVVNIDQVQQPRPLQIVQEDGLGGAISSEDFVCPPRGARRKGPLTIVGRANAGLRRKNKDTCVQCRLNKRKVHPKQNACRLDPQSLTDPCLV